MGKIPALIPISELRQDAAAVLKQGRESNQHLVITQRGRAAAVMLNVETYEKSEHERQLLMQLLKGDKEIAPGRGHSLESVFEEADRILASDS